MKKSRALRMTTFEIIEKLCNAIGELSGIVQEQQYLLEMLGISEKEMEGMERKREEVIQEVQEII